MSLRSSTKKRAFSQPNSETSDNSESESPSNNLNSLFDESDPIYHTPTSSNSRIPLVSNPKKKSAIERSLYETPKVGRRDIDVILSGKRIIPIPENLKRLRFWLPFVYLSSLVLLFIFPPAALVFLVSFVAWVVVMIKIKKYVAEQMKIKIIPKITF